MNRLRTWTREIFRLSHGQANGLLLLFPLMMIVLFSQPLWQAYVSRRPLDLSQDVAMLDSIVDLWSTRRTIRSTQDTQNLVPLYGFDPNTADSSKFVELGFKPALAARVIRFRNNGGKFRVKADLGKIYGLDSTFYSRLYPFIELPIALEARQVKQKVARTERPRFVRESLPSFDLNAADTSVLKKIKGVGEKLSVRIIRYREALGGFIREEQLREVFGLDSLVVSRITEKAFIDTGFKPRCLDVNTVSEKELADHPYLERSEARSIVSYRFQHGNFTAVEDLGKIAGLSPGTLTRIGPYLVVAPK